MDKTVYAEDLMVPEVQGFKGSRVQGFETLRNLGTLEPWNP
jgi:hypothetical protein